MLHITTWEQFETVPDPRIRAFLEDRRQLLTSEQPYDPPEDGGFIIVETPEEIDSEFDFIGSQGPFSDLFDESPPFSEDFASPFEYACSYPQYGLHELSLQFNDNKGLVILTPDSIVNQRPDVQQSLDLLVVPQANLEESP